MKSTHVMVVAMAAGLAATASAHPVTKGRGMPTKQSLDKAGSIYVPETLPFNDNFDSYAVGSPISTVGTWKLWAPGAPDGTVGNAKAFSGKNSFSTIFKSDNVQISTPGQYTSGKWVCSTMTYIDSTIKNTGGALLIALNTFDQVSGPNNWSAQIGVNCGPGELVGAHISSLTVPEPGALPVIYDKWVEIRMEIDLDADTWLGYYDGHLCTPTGVSWSQGVSGGGKVAIECFDFYSSGAVGFLFDDAKFEENVSCYPDCDGSGGLDIDDFICFQTFFAIGDPYADCDASGTLNIDDFICFQTFFAIGC
jgi:hypothetical protein